MEKRTALYEEHVRLKGKMVSFAGYVLPIQYEDGVIKEHHAVREHVGIFDVSHMSEFLVKGEQATSFLDYMMSNQMSGMLDGQIKYTPMLNHEGGIVDDLLVYRLHEFSYLLVANAANHDKDFAWLEKHCWDDIELMDASNHYSQVAIQGPKSMEMMKELMKEEDIPQKYYTFTEQTLVGGVPCLVSRNGYTGEDGVELYFHPQYAIQLYQTILEVGKSYGLMPCGLGARDTLRLEAGMPLYGHEMSETITPLEVGLGFFVKMKKEQFIGKQALLDHPGDRKRVGLKLIDRGIAREHCILYQDDQEIGIVTSGTHLPYLNEACAMGLVNKESSGLGSEVSIDVRGRRLKATVVALPFYKRK